ncbi:alpha/beta fold hydrolase [Nocardioides sp.]|uniref:alpha/beta fold hydrolase n=1 Tax=Nocardioides sp. TaxID=35761 RepID=UPI002ED46C35
MRSWLVAAAVGLLLAGCSTEPEEPSSAPTPSESPTEAASAEPSETATTEPSANPEDRLPKVHHPVSLPALMRERPDGGRPRITATELETDAYARHQVVYRSGDLTVSGVLLRPRGPGPFPGIVLNHGYIDPSYYVTGQGMAREQDALARAGFVVLHTDYRGHAASDDVPDLDRETRLGYTRDAINAVEALGKLPYVDDDRLAMLGRSMGGGVTMNALVAQPGLVDAAVIYASVSSSYLENVDHFTRPNRPEAVQALHDRFGTPREAPRFYRELSSRTYFDRVTEPVLAHHGEVDGTCPPRWAARTQQLMRRSGVDSRLVWYPGEDHAFYARWQQSMDSTLDFLREQFRSNR